MTTLTGSQQTLRAALVTIDPVTSVPTVIAFQYNPHTLSRSFEVRGGTGGPEAGQLTGPPAETIQIEVVLEASDAHEAGEGEDGVAPQLAALLGLITPPSTVARATQNLAAEGAIEVLPMPGPITLFVWGARRVLPVSVTELSISEESHDAQLNPILARVSIAMRVLTYADLPPNHPGNPLSMASQVAREKLAASVTGSSLDNVLGSNVPLV